MSTGVIIVITRVTIITSLISPSWSVPSFSPLWFALTFIVAIICYHCHRCSFHYDEYDSMFHHWRCLHPDHVYYDVLSHYRKHLDCQFIFTSKCLWTLSSLSSLLSFPGLSPMSYCHHNLPIWLWSLERLASFPSILSFLESYAMHCERCDQSSTVLFLHSWVMFLIIMVGGGCQ